VSAVPLVSADREVASGRRRGASVAAAVVAVLVLAGTWLVTSSPASAAGTIDAQAIALAPSASCLYGDVDITYAAAGVSDASVSFTAADGAVLDGYAGAAYQSDFSGTEHVLTQADEPAADGTILGVYVWVGTAPPSAGTTGEFFVLYRCDGSGGSGGGANEVLQTCVGPYGTCPQTAYDALNPSTSTTSTSTTSTPTTSIPTTSVPTTSTAPPHDGAPDHPTRSGVVVPKFTG
jgi:hypothetical protein